GFGYRGRITDGGQLHKPYAVGEAALNPRADLYRQSCLADPANTGQCDNLMRFDGSLDLGQLRLATDKAGGRRSQIPGRGTHGLERWKFRAQSGAAYLKQLDWVGNVAQPPRPQRHQFDATEQSRCGAVEQNLAAMACCHHPRGAVEHHAEVVAAT